MVEIKKRMAGNCSCGNVAEYHIGSGLRRPLLRGSFSTAVDRQEWSGPTALCQACILALIRDDEKLRSILLLQGGAR